MNSDRVDGTKLGQLSSKTRSDNTSGVKGVSLIKSCGKWLAYIDIKGKRISLGGFQTVEEAARARRAAEKSTSSRSWKNTAYPRPTSAANRGWRHRPVLTCLSFFVP